MSYTKQNEQAARASRDTLLSILETLPGALFFVDNAETIIYTNARAQTITGATHEELRGKPLWSIAPQLISTSLYQAVQKARQTGEPTEVEYISSLTQTWLHVDISPTSEGLTIFFHENRQPVRLQTARDWNEQMYRDLLESFSDGVTILTPDGLILDINQRPLIDAHIQRAEAIGRLFTDLPAWSYAPATQQQLRTAIEQASKGETVHFEARIYPQPGMYLDILMTITSHRDANQQVEYLICAGRDITRRKQAEDQLRNLVDAIPHFVWMMCRDGSSEYSNQQWCDYTNMTPEQLQGNGWLECLHPDDRQRVQDAWQFAIQTGTPYEVEHRIQDGRTGKYRWFLARGIPSRDSQGEIQRWFGTCTDIDEQKSIEQALRQSQQRLRALMDSNVIGIIASNGEEIVEANDAFLHMTGYSREDVQNCQLNWAHMTPPEYQPITQQAHRELTHHLYMMPYEKEYICKNGSHLPVVVGGIAFPDNPLHYLAFVLDNSARKELEQRKDDFISMASHELKTPLTSLKLYTQLLGRHLARQGISSAAPSLSKMEILVKRLERLIEELLDVSKIQAGRLEYVQEPVDLGALLQEAVETMQQISTTHTIVLNGVTSLVLIGDRGRLEQVFINLISNAIKYSPNAKTVEINLSASTEAASICVCDHGIGISQEQHKKIFERFYRAFEPNQETISGLGMGLYIVAEIIMRHGGTIIVDSEVGRGSTFRVTLPLKRDI